MFKKILIASITPLLCFAADPAHERQYGCANLYGGPVIKIGYASFQAMGRPKDSQGKEYYIVRSQQKDKKGKVREETEQVTFRLSEEDFASLSKADQQKLQNLKCGDDYEVQRAITSLNNDESYRDFRNAKDARLRNFQERFDNNCSPAEHIRIAKAEAETAKAKKQCGGSESKLQEVRHVLIQTPTCKLEAREKMCTLQQHASPVNDNTDGANGVDGAA
jgi:hypothetical protein